jgi:hypothetical protein
MTKRNKTFLTYALEIGKSVFETKTINEFFQALNSFINLLGMPKRYTDFKQISKVTDNDIK